MYNAKFTFTNGKDIYPIYMNSEDRKKLKEMIGDQIEVMWCSCRTDKKLFYRISEDLKFYPEHNGYIHSPYCTRFKTEDSKRRSAIVRSDEEMATIYLKFNPQNFTIPSVETDDDTENNDLYENSSDNEPSLDESDDNEIMHLKKAKVDSEAYKEPNFNLATFIRCINHDTFTERVINNKPILSNDYFLKSLFGRLKYIRISKMKKDIRSLSLEEDGVRFFYAPYVRIEKKESAEYISYHVIMKGNDNKEYAYFTFSSIYEKALKQFHKQYGIEPNDKTLAAGFQYYPKSKSGKNYKVIGRLHLFQISDHGVYCESLYEQNCYNIIINYVKKHYYEKVKFYIPVEDDVINGIIEIEGCAKKGIIIFSSTKKTKDFTVDLALFVPLLIKQSTEFTENIMDEFVNRIKKI